MKRIVLSLLTVVIFGLLVGWVARFSIVITALLLAVEGVLVLAINTKIVEHEHEDEDDDPEPDGGEPIPDIEDDDLDKTGPRPVVRDRAA